MCSSSNMFSISSLPSATAAFSAYTAFAAWAMLVRNIYDQIQSVIIKIIPEQLRNKILTALGSFVNVYPSPELLTIVVNNNQGSVFNRLFEAAELYLPTKICSSVDRLAVSQGPKDDNLSLFIEKDQEIVDSFQGVQLRWKAVSAESEKGSNKERKSFELSFQKRQMKKVLQTYLPYVLERSKAIKEETKVIKLYSLNFNGDNFKGERWGWINLEHPATFDTLAMDQEMKRKLKEDLDRFVTRREYYRKVGKAWKRGYLLYGPPGTGKSSLVAAMANYLNFNIYDLELASVHSNSGLKNLLVGTANRSIIVIEDIDCNVELQDRAAAAVSTRKRHGDNQFTLSGLLNVIDGLWSSLGDERIIVFTTNHKDRLDPALLRPGRMDMHIHMSYCTLDGFKLLASNYLGVKEHQLFGEIEELMKDASVTPAEVAEELMKSDDADIALKEFLDYLKRKATTTHDHECQNSNFVDAASEERQDHVEPRIPNAETRYDGVLKKKEKKGRLCNDRKRAHREIEGLMKETKMTPAKLIEELVGMKSGDAEMAVKGILDFLERKKTAEVNDESQDEEGYGLAADQMPYSYFESRSPVPALHL